LEKKCATLIDIKADTISIKCNERLCYKVKDIKSDKQITRNLTVYSTSKSLALGYTFTNHCTYYGSRKRMGLVKVT